MMMNKKLKGREGRRNETSCDDDDDREPNQQIYLINMFGFKTKINR